MNNFLLTIPSEILLSDNSSSINTLTSCKESLYQNIYLLESNRYDDDALINSSEGLWSTVKNILFGITNVFIRILNNLKTGIFKFYKDVKRTELKAYIESHKTTVIRINNLNFSDIQSTRVSFPNGLVDTYLNTISKINETLNAIDISTKSNLAVTTATNIYNSIIEHKQISNIVDSGISSMNIDNLKTIFKISDNCINKSKNTTNETRTFETLFLTMQEFIKSVNTTLEGIKYVDQTAFAHSKMAACHDIFTNIISSITNSAGTNVTKGDILKLSKLAYNIAEIFDMFGSTLMDYHKIEHNLVEVYNDLYVTHLK